MKNQINNEEVFAQIFDPGLLTDRDLTKDYRPPSYEEIGEVINLIANEEREEAFQTFFSKYPHFLFRSSLSAGGTNIGLLVKPPIGNEFIADFAIVTVGQGGCCINLIELERPQDNLFTQKRTPAKRLQAALGQITDWKQWIESNKRSFSNVILQLLKSAPRYPKRGGNGSFRLCDKNAIESAWNGFGGNDDYYYCGQIIIGRWALMEEEHRKRLIYHNRSFEHSRAQIRTYDQVIRLAIQGPGLFE